ncbi:class I SAM-dependent DNA methyltransferase [Bacillus sp. FJAT-45350]|uniref:class I SAM-dependent DNA methyltransferase n=1 Tax=Bacillus sp. FJAT-45350 TaxID=2011014 RepID=UPI000BB8F8F8|nr:class I SAM-dependent methyltransferase [Bacillus sp. FJAT-45350]
MTYQGFAYLYDKLMDEEPYNQWFQFFERKQQQYAPTCKEVLDVGCGTGSFLLRLAKGGYLASGVDLSPDMLTVTQEKLNSAGYSVPLFQQNMCQLEMVDKFDAVTVFCDSLNYLEEERDVMEAFRSIHQQLKTDGLFLFDVHTSYKMNEVFAEQTFAETEDTIAYIWNSFHGEYEDSVEHELTFFAQHENGLFERIEELHKQRTFPIDTYKNWLRDSGFEVLEVTADFHDNEIQPTSERIFFVTKKLDK